MIRERRLLVGKKKSAEKLRKACLDRHLLKAIRDKILISKIHEINYDWVNSLKNEYCLANCHIFKFFTLQIVQLLQKFFSTRPENRNYRKMMLQKLVYLQQQQ